MLWTLSKIWWISEYRHISNVIEKLYYLLKTNLLGQFLPLLFQHICHIIPMGRVLCMPPPPKRLPTSCRSLSRSFSSIYVISSPWAVSCACFLLPPPPIHTHTHTYSPLVAVFPFPFPAYMSHHPPGPCPEHAFSFHLLAHYTPRRNKTCYSFFPQRSDF